MALKIFGGIKNKEILITVGINAITFACDKEPFVEFTYELMKLNYIDWENVYPQEKKAIACVNSSYVEKAFKAIGGKQTNIHITDESQPIVLRPIEKDIEKNIEFLIMPITTLDEPEEVK
ncbi:MAG: hypothetical protein GWN62_09945 [Aliifodinibius sp.]|nr:hypothetical protein [Fodinibius sp.]NIW80952.1 hypothetical protein [Calditrichia bacterium]